jgi:probable F420-dependent oxidoreductase
MRFTLYLEGVGLDQYVPLALAAEEAGWTTVCVPDSLFFAERTVDDAYPYQEADDMRDYIRNTVFLDSVVAIATMAAVTTRLRFFPSVLKTPARRPLVLAKQFGSLGALSGGRVFIGVGIGPWREDMTYHGVDYESRGAILDEQMQILRAAMTGEFFEFHGKHFDFGSIRITPVPDTPPAIIVGGHSRPALRRAARLGDGWISVPSDRETLAGHVEKLRRELVEAGTASRRDFEIHGMVTTLNSVDDARRFEEIGVTDACYVPWDAGVTTVSGRVDAIKRFGDEVITGL